MAIIRPVNLQKPFADAGARRDIPVDSQIGIDNGAASFTDGFPPLTRTPIAAGGIPPKGVDMNGILFALSQHTVFQNAGGQYRFDAELATEIGGYPSGVVLQSDDGLSSYVNILAGNATNFNTTPASIGVSWLPYSGGRLLNVQVFATAGTFTYTPTLGTKSLVVEVQGGGGGGGGTAAQNATNIALAGGGGAGGYSLSRLTNGFSGVSVVVGVGGGGGGPGANGSAGGTSSFGVTLSATGGIGGLSSIGAVPPYTFAVTGGGAGTGGNVINSTGGPSTPPFAGSADNGVTGGGGHSKFGAGGQPATNINGNSATNSGAGGSGGGTYASNSARTGGNGAPGRVTIWEYA